MSYFATFYSYKGGVGRTLALANTAWLIANHATESARVLVVDFDLGAPGLHRVFGMKRASKSPGIVDYVTSYLKEASIPDIAKHIHRTAHQNIDIIPAGQMDPSYQRRLESINWSALYESAFGYELIEKLKSDISSIRPEYDYVLIDSLTGYTDVGGICVNQLPDLLILLFRLNQQNLDGIDKVNRKVATSTSDGTRKTVIPIITPSWPFIDEAATKWIKKAQSLFPGQRLSEISFDSSLSFGERIISKEASKLPLASKLLHDYRRLAFQIREKNPSDPLTIWNSIRHGVVRTIADPAGLYLRLLQRRPTVLEYWRELSLAGPRLRSQMQTSEAWKELLAFVDQESDKGNPLALFARAQLLSDRGETNRDRAKSDLDKALQLSPDFLDALVERAHFAYQEGQFEDAIRGFSKGLSIAKTKGDFPWQKIAAELADAYLRIYDGKGALRAIEAALTEGAEDPSIYRIRARANYLVGDYSPALADARRSAKYYGSQGAPALLPSQILAAMGQIDEAERELETYLSHSENRVSANLAEAYLAVNPKRSIALLEANPSDVSRVVRSLLTRLARILSGEGLDSSATIDKSASVRAERVSAENWVFFEVVALLRAKERSGQTSPETIRLAYDAIELAAGPAEFSLIQRNRPGRTGT